MRLEKIGNPSKFFLPPDSETARADQERVRHDVGRAQRQLAGAQQPDPLLDLHGATPIRVIRRFAERQRAERPGQSRRAFSVPDGPPPERALQRGELPELARYQHAADAGLHAEHAQSVLPNAVAATARDRVTKEHRQYGKNKR